MKLKKDIFLKENHPMTISSKFSSYWANSFRHTFGREPPKDHFSKVWLRLAR
jgi:hypothetical protein